MSEDFFWSIQFWIPVAFALVSSAWRIFVHWGDTSPDPFRIPILGDTAPSEWVSQRLSWKPPPPLPWFYTCDPLVLLFWLAMPVGAFTGLAIWLTR